MKRLVARLRKQPVWLLKEKAAASLRSSREGRQKRKPDFERKQRSSSGQNWKRAYEQRLKQRFAPKRPSGMMPRAHDGAPNTNASWLKKRPRFPRDPNSILKANLRLRDHQRMMLKKSTSRKSPNGST